MNPIVFRYRDLVEPTLEEHGKILKAEQKVWWGWWKRPGEPDRQEVWSALQAELATAGKARIFLFDSGPGVVHAAWIDQLHPPVEGAAGGAVKLTSAELELVPPYYRGSPYSRGWMRIVELDPLPIDFFGKYSFDGAPPLAGFARSVLDKLDGKVVLDADELKLMDATVWQVRPASADDSRERFLAPSRELLEPVSATPIGVRGKLILHLTDLHFAVGKHRAQHVWRLETEKVNARSTLAEAIAAALHDRRRDVGVLLVTGDLTFLNSDAEFGEALKSLARLRELLELSRDQVVIIPGNHDLAWTKEPQATYDPAVKVDVNPEEAEQRYRTALFKQYYRFEADRWLAMARRYVFPEGVVEIVAVNSSSLESGKQFLAGMGRVQEGGFTDAANALGWDNPSLALRILALHHHLAPTEDLENPAEFTTGFGIAIDAARTQRLAAARGVHLALHGHKHRAFLWRAGVFELPENAQKRWKLGELSIVGGGSAGSSSVDHGSNYFNLLEVSGGALKLELFRSVNAGSFESFQAWSAPLSIAGGRLALGDFINR